MNVLSILFGAIVGLSLGLTGGGGAMFAVPLLVYGLAIPPREAVMISLAAVGATSFMGFLHRWALGEVGIRTGLLFAAAGMMGAPIGTWLSSLIPEGVLLLSFAGLMVIIAVRLWQQATNPSIPRTDCPPPGRERGPTCQRDAAGRLILTSRCAMLLLTVGVFTGMLAGLFGVGGGFVIVPALILFSGMSVHRAVGTSLMVGALVSLSGIATQIGMGRTILPMVTGLFVLGGLAGLFAGQRISRRLSGPTLQKVFALAILAMAIFVFARNLSS